MAMANQKRDKIQLGLEEAGVNSKNAQKDLQKALQDAKVDIKAFAAAQKASINSNIKSELAPNERKKKQPEQDAAPAPKSPRLGQ